MRNLDLYLNGRCTGPLGLVISPISAKAASWFGSSSEYNNNNNWIVNFGSGNCNNTNKNNSNVARGLVALEQQVLEGWVEAFEDCCLHKKSSAHCTEYRLNASVDIPILALQIEILAAYKPGTSICFIVSVPRIREIFAAAFRDRIVQHWICLRLRFLFEERYISHGNVTFNGRVGYGTIAAANRAQQAIADLTDCYKNDGWVATIDIWSFFMTIDKNVLWSFLRSFIAHNAERIRAEYPETKIETLLWVTEIVVMHAPQKDCEFRGNLSLRERLDPWKSLLNALEDIGMAIGNITSQDLANFLMSFIDEWAVGFCRERGMIYIRFVDDILTAGLSKEDLIQFRKELCEYLSLTLHQKVHPDKFYIQPARHGVKFVGRIIKPGRNYTGNRTVGNFHNAMHKLDKFCRKIINGDVTVQQALMLEHLVSSVNSLFGFLQHSASRNIKLQAIGTLTAFWKVCYIVNCHIVRIRKKYKVQTILISQKDEENSYYQALDSGDFVQYLSAEEPYHQLRRRRTRRRKL